jgi:hypothetical protein
MPKRALVVLALTTVAGLAAFAAVAGAAASDGDRDLRAHLIGEREVPGPGDPDGWGIATVDVRPRRGETCFRMRWRHIEPPTASHIHFGRRREAGPVVVTLFATSAAPDQPPTLPDTINGVRGCTDLVVLPDGAPFNSTTQLLRNIDRHPGRYYVNVHNLDFPAGAIRGQLRAVQS